MLPYADLWSVITSQPTQVTGILAFVRTGTGRHIYSATLIDPNFIGGSR